MVEHGPLHAGSRVVDAYDDLLSRGADHHPEFAPLGHGVQGVEHQVQYHLHQVVLDDEHRRGLRIGIHPGDYFLGPLVIANQLQRVVHHGRDGDVGRLVPPPPAEIHDLPQRPA